MTHLPLSRLLSLTLAVLLLTAGQATAQPSLGGSGGSSPDGGRPQTTRAGVLELLRSSGMWATDAIQSIGVSANEPKWDATSSPQAAVLTFLHAMEEVAIGQDDAWGRALKAIGDDSPTNREAALRLADVFSRLPEITPSSMPAEETVSERGISRWELFPRGIDSEWAYSAIDGGPEGSIELVQTPDGWRFSESTIDGADTLAESMKAIPPRPLLDERGGLFRQTVGPTFLQTPWWGWPVFLLTLLGGIALAWGLVHGINWLAKKLEDAGDEIVAPLVRGLTIPAAVLAAAAGFLLATAAIHLEPALDRYRLNVAKFLFLVAGIWLVVNALEMLLFVVRRLFVRDSDPYGKMAATVVRRLLRVAAILLLTVYVFQYVLEWNVTAVIGGIGLVGLALSLAAKDAVANLFGAFMIFMSRPFLVGDWIVFNDTIGEVIDVSLQVTKVRVLGGEVLSVPNHRFVDNEVENLSMRTYKRRVMNIQITYDTPIEKVREAMDILDDILRSDDVVGDGQGDMQTYPPKINFDAFGPHYLNLRVDYWYLMSPPDSSDRQRDTDRGYLSYLAHRSTVNQLVLERFNEAGIDFAFPTQTIVLDEDGPIRVASTTADSEDDEVDSPGANRLIAQRD